MSRIAFIDLEASGLGSATFPTEIGWAIIGEDGSVGVGFLPHQTDREVDYVCERLEPDPLSRRNGFDASIPAL
jgi:hypothetical protein